MNRFVIFREPSSFQFYGRRGEGMWAANGGTGASNGLQSAASNGLRSAASNVLRTAANG